VAKVRLPYNPNVTADTIRECLERRLGKNYTVKAAGGPFADWWVAASPLKGATVKLKQAEGKETTITINSGAPSLPARLFLPLGMYAGFVLSGPVAKEVTQALENDPALRPTAPTGP
jgi:hypothetical protein